MTSSSGLHPFACRQALQSESEAEHQISGGPYGKADQRGSLAALLPELVVALDVVTGCSGLHLFASRGIEH